MTAEEVLAGAADLLETHGWCQGRWGKEWEDTHCLHGAILTACRHDWPMYEAAWAAVKKELAPIHPLLYNDTPERTVEEVVTILHNSKRWL